MEKYPRTYHFSFSPEIHSDDKVIDKDCEKSFIGREVVVLEKLDGGNACLKNGKVFARTHSTPAVHDSFSMLKQINNFLKYDIDGLEIFGENLQGIHSIDYGEIESPFYIFNIREDNIWHSWDNVVRISKKLNIPVVPEVFRGKFSSLKELEEFLSNELKKPSLINGSAEREGFVIRPVNEFLDNEFSCFVGKYVRQGHVQSNEHWSSNWQEANIKSSFWTKLYGE
jgi:hypothetical protein